MKWKRLTSTTVYDNPWITVYDEQVINPAGGENRYGRVSFKNRAVAILPLAENGDTWLVGQQRYTLGAYSWELPMGGAPLHEDPLAAAKRELREETGLRATRWSEIMQLHLSNSITDEVGIVYLAEDLAEGPTAFDETEVLDVRRLPLRDAVRMAESGEITDALSIAALLRLRHLA
ncbi:MAG TPA: NUDIX hydrolase [Woeseiaceae bacterium]